jgi:hypothetical protein
LLPSGSGGVELLTVAQDLAPTLGTLCAISYEPHRGADRDRTDDLLVANEALSQLSYSPLFHFHIPCSLIYKNPQRQSMILHRIAVFTARFRAEAVFTLTKDPRMIIFLKISRGFMDH